MDKILSKFNYLPASSWRLFVNITKNVPKRINRSIDSSFQHNVNEFFSSLFQQYCESSSYNRGRHKEQVIYSNFFSLSLLLSIHFLFFSNDKKQKRSMLKERSNKRKSRTVRCWISFCNSVWCINTFLFVNITILGMPFLKTKN
jgi:hypothetical protein